MSVSLRLCAVGASCALTAGCFSLASIQPTDGGSAGARSAAQPSHVKRLVADYGYWSKDQVPSYSADQIPFHELTHIIHAEIEADVDGSIWLPRRFLEPELIARAHAAGVKVMVLVGAPAATFRALAADPSARMLFASKLRAFVERYGYDGVDVDWEYPHGTADATGFARLMGEIRARLPSPAYTLSIDVPSDPRQVGAAYDFRHLLAAIDFVNDMTYDMAGPWTASAQLNSPIYTDPRDPQPEGSDAASLDLFMHAYGIPPSKINLGTPFYGYHYTSTDDLYDPCRCRGQAKYVNYGTYVKPRIDQMGWRSKLDSRTATPYLLHGRDETGFITYDDAVSTYRRVAYGLWTRDVGGVFMWALDEDYDGHSQDLLDAMYAAYTNPQAGLSGD